VLRRRLEQSARPPAPDELACPSFDEVRIHSAVLAYVVGEGHHDETIFGLALMFSPGPESAAVEMAVRDLVGEHLLKIEGGKVTPGRTWHPDPLPQ